MINLKPTLLHALSSLPSVVVAAFPIQEYALPVITVADERGGVSAQADGQDYLEEYIFVLNVYAASMEEMEALSCQADECLAALGLRRIFQQDFFDEQAYAWRKLLRYRCLVQGENIYQ